LGVDNYTIHTKELSELRERVRVGVEEAKKNQDKLDD
jgi:hypothetical protein